MKVSHVGQFLKFCLCQQLFARVLHGKKITNIFKLANVTKSTRAILKRSYGVLQVTSE